MKRKNRETQSLQLLAEQFIVEQFKLRQISLKEAVDTYTFLIGLKEPFAAPGFIAFLHALGIMCPTVKDFASHNVGLHWEFLAQRHGVLRAGFAMAQLRRFWLWCVAIGIISKTRMPADLNCPQIDSPLEIHVSISRVPG